MTEKLLRLVGPVHVVAGLLVFATAFSPAAQDFLKSLIATDDASIWSSFFVAILGPTIASWGVLFTALVNQYFASPSLGLWKAMVFSIIVWAPLDTALCLYYGIWIGAFINAAIVIVLTGLLLSARKSLP
jgi:hypothetical protein